MPKLTVGTKFKWMKESLYFDTALSEIYLILADVDDKIELRKTDLSAAYFQSMEVQLQKGNYCGQLIIGGEVYDIEDVEIDPLNIVIDIKLKETSLIIYDKDQGESNTLEVNEMSSAETINKEIQVSYSLNEKASYSKKME